MKEWDIEPTQIVSGGARGVDKLGEEWALKNGIQVQKFPAAWNDIKAEGAVVKSRTNPWTKKEEKYNSNAGFARNKQMAQYADALVAIDYGTGGTNNMIKMAQQEGIKIFVYNPRPKNPVDGYIF